MSAIGVSRLGYSEMLVIVFSYLVVTAFYYVSVRCAVRRSAARTATGAEIAPALGAAA